MQVFKLCLCKIARNPLFFIIYVIGLSFMGLAMAASLSGALSPGEFERQPTQFAVIDRDDSTLSRGVVEYLQTQGEQQPIDDTKTGLQDAVAKGRVEYILVIPDGYEQSFAEAVSQGGVPELLESVYSFDAATGVLVDQRVNNYINIIFDLLVAGDAGAASTPGETGASGQLPEGLLDNAVSAGLDLVGAEAAASYMDAGTQSDGAQFLFYLEWSMYGLFAGVVVSVCGLNGSLSQTDLRRRTAVAPLTQLSYNAQVALACLVLGAAAWAWDFGLGYVVFHDSAAALSGAALWGLAGSLFSFVLLALSVGFLVSKLHCGITAANAVGNIGGLVLSFMGGAWVPLSVMSAEMVAVAHFLPGYWYTVACQQAATLPKGLSVSEALAQLTPVAGSLAVVLLFALAFFLVALVLGKVRTRD